MLRSTSIIEAATVHDDGAPPSLGEVLARVRSDLLLVHHAGHVGIDAVVLHEPQRGRLIPPRAVVLAVGYAAGDALFDDLMRDAALADAAAVIAKPSTVGRDEFRQLGERHGVSTVLAPQAADWLTLALLLRSACAVAVASNDGPHEMDTFAFANAVALATGGATAIVDVAGHIVGFSNLPDQPLDELRSRTTLLMEELDSPVSDPEYERIYATDGCIHSPGDGSTFDRIAAAVRSDAEILGSIWVLVPEPEQRDHAERALLQLLDSAAVHLHQARLSLSIERSRDAVLLETLLRDDDRAASSVAALEFKHREWFRLALLITDTPLTAAHKRQVQGLTHWLTVSHPGAVFAEIESQLVVLFSGVDPEEWAVVARSLAQVCRGALITRSGMAIATSLPVVQPEALRGEFTRLCTLSRLVAQDRITPARDSRLLRMEDHMPQVELAMIADAYGDADAGRLTVLRAIREFDRAQHTEYWPTLQAYALTNRSPARAAARLHVHPNTVRYRLERLAEVFGLDMNDVATFAWVVIQSYRSRPALDE